MTWGLKIVLAGMACKDWILPNFNLDLQLLSLCYVDMHSRYLQYYHTCMFRSVCGMPKRLCPSVVALACTWAAKLISCTNNKVLITLGGPFYGSFAA